MKKILLVVIAVMAAVCLACCTDKDDMPQNTPVSENNQVDYDQTQPQLDIRITDSLDTAKLEDGTVLYDINIQKVNSYVLQNQQFMTCSKAVNKMIDTALTIRKKDADEFKNALYDFIATSGTEQAGLPWSMSAIYKVEKNDGKAVSISENVEESMGSLAQGSVNAVFGYNFDALTGEQISLESICANDTERQTFETLISTKLVNKYGAETFEGYDKRSTYLLLGDDSWYFSPEGITIFYNTTEIAPAVAGSFEINVSKQELPQGFQKYFFS